MFSFHGEFNVWGQTVEVIKKQVERRMIMQQNDKGVRCHLQTVILLTNIELAHTSF